jgi:hypothetical protein
MATITPTTTYTQTCKIYYKNHHTEILNHMVGYYESKKEEIKLKRRARYARQKAEKLASQAIPSEEA